MINNEEINKNSSFSIIIVFLVIVVILFVMTFIVNNNKKKVLKKENVYTINTAVKYDGITLKVKSANNIECSITSQCDRMEDHNLVVEYNSKTYDIDVNDNKYIKIEGTNKYIYSTIRNGKIVLGVSRNYNVLEAVKMFISNIFNSISNFLEKVKEFNIGITHH